MVQGPWDKVEVASPVGLRRAVSSNPARESGRYIQSSDIVLTKQVSIHSSLPRSYSPEMHNPGASPEGAAFDPTHAAPPDPHLRFPDPARPQFTRREYPSVSTAAAQSRSPSHVSPIAAPGKFAQNPDPTETTCAVVTCSNRKQVVINLAITFPSRTVPLHTRQPTRAIVVCLTRLPRNSVNARTFAVYAVTFTNLQQSPHDTLDGLTGRTSRRITRLVECIRTRGRRTTARLPFTWWTGAKGRRIMPICRSDAFVVGCAWIADDGGGKGCAEALTAVCC